jgi:hypothetical protein
MRAIQGMEFLTSKLERDEHDSTCLVGCCVRVMVDRDLSRVGFHLT